MKVNRKYALAVGIAVLVSAASILLNRLLGESLMVTLYGPTFRIATALQLERMPFDPYLPIAIILLLAGLQFFIVAMSLITFIQMLKSLRNYGFSAGRKQTMPCLLWSAASLGILVSMIYSYRDYGHKHRALQLAAQGREIVREIRHYGVQYSLPVRLSLPTEEEYATSTDYFNSLVEKDYFADISIFLVPGKSVKDRKYDASMLLSRDNPWGVALVSPSMPYVSFDGTGFLETPFLISRNIGFGDPPRPYEDGMTTADMNGLIHNDELLGSSYGVVITYGGMSYVLSKKDARPEWLNPSNDAFKVLMP